ncbi:oligosaccharide flippase family protein [Zhongshania sp. BJYM1]|uniref:oligosaccharide flippase family protein n=1 Tax=Zhongshania aquatica TaxID=2965069 RepID=UPI0022B363F4|nr:oligosaccharide flippase family protein [Marortus sp. BJYM1]
MIVSKIKRVFTDGDNRELILSAAFAFVVRVLGAFSGFLVTYFVAKSLGAAESGRYFLALSIVMVLSSVSRAGLDNTVLRFVGGTPELAINVMAKALMVVTILGLVFSSVAYFSAGYISLEIFGKVELKPILQKMSFGILALSVVTISSMALQGLRRVSASIFVLNIAVNTLLIGSIFTFGITNATELGAFYTLCSILIAAIGISFFLCFAPRTEKSSIPWKELFASCWPLWIVVVMAQMVQWSGQFVAGAYVSSDLVAQFAVAQRTAMLTSFVLIAVNLVVAPRFAALYRQDDSRGLEILAIKSVKIICVLALPVVGGMLIFPEKLMGIFGEEFVTGAYLLQILAIGQFVNAVTGSVGFLLIMSGNERDMRTVTLISGSLAMVLTWGMTVAFGVLGAALATAIAVSAQNLMAVYFVKKRLGFNTLLVWR